MDNNMDKVEERDGLTIETVLKSSKTVWVQDVTVRYDPNIKAEDILEKLGIPKGSPVLLVEAGELHVPLDHFKNCKKVD